MGGNSKAFFLPYFPPLKPRYVLWSGASYSPKNTVYYFFTSFKFYFNTSDAPFLILSPRKLDNKYMIHYINHCRIAFHVFPVVKSLHLCHHIALYICISDPGLTLHYNQSINRHYFALFSYQACISSPLL